MPQKPKPNMTTDLKENAALLFILAGAIFCYYLAVLDTVQTMNGKVATRRKRYILFASSDYTTSSRRVARFGNVAMTMRHDLALARALDRIAVYGTFNDFDPLDVWDPEGTNDCFFWETWARTFALPMQITVALVWTSKYTPPPASLEQRDLFGYLPAKDRSHFAEHNVVVTESLVTNRYYEDLVNIDADVIVMHKPARRVHAYYFLWGAHPMLSSWIPPLKTCALRPLKHLTSNGLQYVKANFPVRWFAMHLRLGDAVSAKRPKMLDKHLVTPATVVADVINEWGARMNATHVFLASQPHEAYYSVIRKHLKNVSVLRYEGRDPEANDRYISMWAPLGYAQYPKASTFGYHIKMIRNTVYGSFPADDNLEALWVAKRNSFIKTNPHSNFTQRVYGIKETL